MVTTPPGPLQLFQHTSGAQTAATVCCRHSSHSFPMHSSDHTRQHKIALLYTHMLTCSRARARSGEIKSCSGSRPSTPGAPAAPLPAAGLRLNSGPFLPGRPDRRLLRPPGALPLLPLLLVLLLVFLTVTSLLLLLLLLARLGTSQGAAAGGLTVR